MAIAAWTGAGQRLQEGASSHGSEPPQGAGSPGPRAGSLGGVEDGQQN